MYGVIYGYHMCIGGVCVTFFTNSTDSGSVRLHYTAFSVTTEMILFDIVLSTQTERYIHGGTKLETLLKVSHTAVAQPITPDYWPLVERIDCGEHDEQFLNACNGTFQIKVRTG